jgi:hypothetical protein
MNRIIGRTLTAALVAAAANVALAGSAPAAEDITLTGCLVRAEDDDAYLLTNVAGEPAWQRADGRVTPGPVGTSGTVATIFYWLTDHDDLKNHVGHRVQIAGDLKGDLTDGRIEIDRKDSWLEITIEANGDDMKARVPASAFSAVPAKGDDEHRNVLVRKVDVGEVKMLAADCM